MLGEGDLQVENFASGGVECDSSGVSTADWGVNGRLGCQRPTTGVSTTLLMPLRSPAQTIGCAPPGSRACGPACVPTEEPARGEIARPRVELTAGNLQLLHLVLERGALDAKDRRGSVDAAHNALCVVQDAGDMFPLDVPERVQARERRRRTGVQLRQVDTQLGSRRQDDTALNKILQLADVAWPLPALQPAHGASRNGQRRAVQAARELADKVVRQRGDAFRPFPQ